MTQRFRCTRRIVVRGAVLIVLGAALLGLGGAPVAGAAEPASAGATEAPLSLPEPPSAPMGTTPPPEQVRALIELLGDPQVRDWLREQLAEPSQPAVGHSAPMEMGTMDIAEQRLEAIRDQFHAMAAATPRLPSALAAAWTTLERDLSEAGILWAILLVGAFVALGFGAQWLYWVLTRPALRHIVSLPMDTVSARVAATLKRFGWGLGWLAAFALGSVGAFLLFDWPPLLRTVVLAYLIAFLGLRLALVLSRFLLAPDAEKFRIVPMETDAAWFWYVWSGVLIGVFCFAWATMQILLALGVEWQVRRLISLGFGLVLFGIAIAIIWRGATLRPTRSARRPGGAARRPRSSSPWPRSCSGCCGSWARCRCSGSRWWRWHCRRPLSCCSARSITSCGRRRRRRPQRRHLA